MFRGQVVAREPSMASDPQDAWPKDLEDLARIAADPSQPAERRNDALGRLQPFCRHIARRIAARFGQQNDESGFVGDAIQHLLLVIHAGQWPNNVPLDRWCRRVVNNLAADVGRRKLRESKRNEKWLALESRVSKCNREYGVIQRALEDVLQHLPEMCPGDLKQVRDWVPAWHSILLLGATGLWTKIPRDEWEQRIADYGLITPFPPDSVCDCDDPLDRAPMIAELCGWPRNTGTVAFRRRLVWLRQLDCLSRLLEEHRDG